MADREHDGMKKCSKCGEWKPATAEFFNRDKTKTDGVDSWCRGCKRKHYEKNKDKIAERMRKYREKNEDKIREYRQQNKDKIKEYRREYYEKNKDKIAEQIREYRQKNKDKIAESKRKHYEKNKDKIKDYQRKHYEKNKDRYLERDHEYYQKNKDKIAERKREYNQSPVGRLSKSINRLRRKTGATVSVRDMTEEQKETLANQYVAIKTLEKTEKELLAASGKKRCPACDRILDYSCFYKNITRNDGVDCWCRWCVNEKRRKYRQKNKKKYLTK